MGTNHTVAVVPSWNGRRLLERFLPTWLDQSLPFAGVLVVDNGSDDGTEALINDTRGAELLRLPRNLGFAGAVNRGVEAALADPGVDLVAVLNNDVSLDREWHREGIGAIEAEPHYGSCATCVLRFDRPGVVESAGIGWNDRGTAYGLRQDQPPPAPVEPPIEVWGASAAAALYRRELFESVGLFNESFFAYQEDVELAMRARRAGWRSVFAPTARARHLGHGSNRSFPLGGTFADYYNARNRIALLVTALPGSDWRRGWRRILAAQLGLIVASLPEGRPGAVWTGVLHGLCRVPSNLAARRRTSAILSDNVERGTPWVPSSN
jgi:GT2 family glycosyltransferase